MANLRFHIVTVVAIFLALALGIIIGSTFTEEGIIVRQRHTIEEMQKDISALVEQKSMLAEDIERQDQAAELMQQWLIALEESYWPTQSGEGKALLVHTQEAGIDLFNFDTEITAILHLPGETEEIADLVSQAIVQRQMWRLAEMEGFSLQGYLAVPDYVLIYTESEGHQFVVDLATPLLDAEVPVVALAATQEDIEFAQLFNDPLYSSVTHIDSALGRYCLKAILRGQAGHYGWSQVLPTIGVGQ